MKYSIILPYYDPGYRKTQMFTNLIKSIVENSKGKDYELIIVKDGPSYVESHNIGFKNAKGDYLVVLNDDVEIQDSQWLEKLTQENSICSWKLGMFHLCPIDLPSAVCFGMSRDVFEKLGLMDEDFKNGKSYEDTDYFLRARKLGIRFYDSKVNMIHMGGQTLGTYFSGWSDDVNKQIFDNKWKNGFM